MNKNDTKFAFLGSSRFSVIVLDELKKSGYTPALIITTPDKPRGRKLLVTPNVVKSWAIQNTIPFLDPEKLDEVSVEQIKAEVRKADIQIFIVASFGKIIPKDILMVPEKGTLNVHPSLLPRYRGASPLQSAMLDDAKKTGVTIMAVDEKMDHGPIVAQRPVEISEWPIYEEFEEMMAREGARLLAETLPRWTSGDIVKHDQDHRSATYTKKIEKGEGLISMSDDTDDQYSNFRKIQAFHGWPQAYFVVDYRGKKSHIKITRASYDDGKLSIMKVIPPGGNEMSYDDFLRGIRR